MKNEHNLQTPENDCARKTFDTEQIAYKKNTSVFIQVAENYIRSQCMW